MSRHASPSGAFEIDSLPGQCQVAVCHSFFVAERHRGRGEGHILKRVQRTILRAAHYDFAVCTVSAKNERQIAILTEQGWKKLDSFYNHRLGETTELWGLTV